MSKKQKKIIRYVKLYDEVAMELNDRAIIDAIKSALNDYSNGSIIECRDTLEKVVDAITEFEREYEL